MTTPMMIGSGLSFVAVIVIALYLIKYGKTVVQNKVLKEKLKLSEEVNEAFKKYAKSLNGINHKWSSQRDKRVWDNYMQDHKGS